MGAGPVWTLHCAYDQMERSPGVLTMGYDNDGRRTALSDPAPVVWVSGQLLRELHWGCPDFVRLTCPPGIDGTPGAAHAAMGDDRVLAGTGDTIRIEGDDCAYVYVISRQVSADPEVWEARWPD